MKAAVCTAYGPPEVLRIEEVEAPVPRAGEVLIKVHASVVSSSDWFVRSGLPSAPVLMRLMMRLAVGVKRPRRRILGLVLAGEIVEVGKSVERFSMGDRVYAFTMLRFGGYAQYACVSASATIARAPSNLSYEQAAALPYGGLLALHYLGKGGLHAGERALIYGASGAVGTAAVQLAKHLGAEVTAVCSTANLGLMTTLGADAAVDYTRQGSPSGAPYDLVFDAVGKRKTSPFKEACARALGPRGRYLSVDDGTPKMRASDLVQVTELAEASVLKPVVDRSYPLEQIAEAHRYVEQEHKKGNVVITVGH